MMSFRYVLAVGAVAAALAGCSTIDKITGQTDNTVLPGQREDAIPGRAQFPDQPDPAVQREASGGTSAGAPADVEQSCLPDDPSCQPAAGSGDAFSDPQ